METTRFRYGDIVRRAKGWTPMRVVRATRYDVELVYCPGDMSMSEVYTNCEIKKVTNPVKEFVRCPGWERRLTEADKTALSRQLHATAEPLPWQTITSEGNTMTKLYQTKEETPRFGTLLAINSAGKLVLEMKGTGEVLTFEKREVEEVKPYTVRVKFVSTNDRTYDFLSRNGDVEVGDLIFIKGYTDMARVEAVDTKSNRATVDLVGRKVVTEPFGQTLVE